MCFQVVLSSNDKNEGWFITTGGTISLINNQLGTASFSRETSEVGSKGWDWSLGSMQRGRARSALFSRVI